MATTEMPQDLSPEYEVEIIYRNGLILKMARERGCTTLAALSRATRISESELKRIVNMLESPFQRNGAWRSGVLALARFFGCAPEALFAGIEKKPPLLQNRKTVKLIAGDWASVLNLLVTLNSLPVETEELRRAKRKKKKT